MTPAEWIKAVNQLLKADPNLTYKEAQQQMLDRGHSRPPGITQKGSSKSGRRFGLKAKRTRGQDLRRAAQEQLSTEEARQQQRRLENERNEQRGIAQASGLPEPHREHSHSQDISGDIREGAPGDYVRNIPEDVAAAKTALEQLIRTRYGGRYAVGIGNAGLRVIPKEYFDEIVNPDDLPGVDINENNSLESQLGVLKSISQQAPPERLGGFQTQQPKINSTAGTIHFKPQPLGGFDTTAAPQIEQEVFAPDDSVRQPAIQRFAAEQMNYATSPQRTDQQIEQLQTAAGMALTVGASLVKTAGGIISYGLMK